MTVEMNPEFEWTGVELLVSALLQLVLVFLAYRLNRAPGSPIISESAAAIFMGLLFGSVLALLSPTEAGKAGLNPDGLFYGLLPPIILEAGFNMKKRGFFSNFTTILSLAVLGTIIATFATGGILYCLGNAGIITPLTSTEAYMFGSLISAVDPVATLSVFKKLDAPPMLFNLVFGESVLNDGVAIVSFSLFQEFVRQGKNEVTLSTGVLVISKVIGIGLGSVALSAMVCFLSALLLKRADPALQEYPTYEISIVLLSAYCSYVVADIAGLSGIVALFFSGVLMSHYHLYNVSNETATALTHLLSTLAFLAENFIYLYLGVSVVAYSSNFIWDFRFIALATVVCIVTRAFNVFPLCMLANLRRTDPIPFKHMIVIWFSGLRGAIAFALTLKVWTPNPAHTGVIQSTTLFIVMFTTLVFGMGTTPLMEYLRLTRSHHRSDNASSGDMEGLLTNPSQEDGNTLATDYWPPTSPESAPTGIHSMWEKVDENYLKPVLGGQLRKDKNLVKEKIPQKE